MPEAFSSQMIEDFLDALQLAIKQIICSEIFSFDLSNFFSELQNKRLYFKNNESDHLSIQLIIMLNSKINYSTFI